MRNEAAANEALAAAAPKIGASFKTPAPIRAQPSRPGFFARLFKRGTK